MNKNEYLEKLGIFEFQLPRDEERLQDFVASQKHIGAKSIAITGGENLDLKWLETCSHLLELRLHTSLSEVVEIAWLRSLELAEFNADAIERIGWRPSVILNGGLILHSPNAKVLGRIGGFTKKLLVSDPPESWPEFDASTHVEALAITRVQNRAVDIDNVAKLVKLKSLIFSTVTMPIHNAERLVALSELKVVKFGDVKRGKIAYEWLYQLPKISGGFYELSPGFFKSEELKKLELSGISSKKP